jgi:hypothetical protein
MVDIIRCHLGHNGELNNSNILKPPKPLKLSRQSTQNQIKT